MTMDAFTLIAQAEGFREFAYDDGSGEPIKPGHTMKGHVTIGFGFNLEEGNGPGMSRRQCETILHAKVVAISLKLRQTHAVFDSFNQARQAALISAAYNLGIQGLLDFFEAWSALGVSDFARAAAEFRDSSWWRNPLTHNRAEQTAKIIETGEWP